MFLKEYQNTFLNNKNLQYDAAKGQITNSPNTTKSNQVCVFIPGIGMDARVFIMQFHKLQQSYHHHLLAVTLKGFNEHQSSNIQIPDQIYTSEEQVTNAVHDIIDFVNFRKLKMVNLFGFSYGADLLCQIAQQLLEQNIKISKMVFSDINYNEETAFLTKTITKISTNKKLTTDHLKKAHFIYSVLNNTQNNDDIVLDILEYFRATYKVKWNQLENAAENAYKNSAKRIDEFKRFEYANNKKGIKYKFYISKRILSKKENGYFSNIEDLLKKIENVSFENTDDHFDGISMATLKSVNEFFIK